MVMLVEERHSGASLLRLSPIRKTLRAHRVGWLHHVGREYWKGKSCGLTRPSGNAAKLRGPRPELQLVRLGRRAFQTNGWAGVVGSVG